MKGDRCGNILTILGTDDLVVKALDKVKYFQLQGARITSAYTVFFITKEKPAIDIVRQLSLQTEATYHLEWAVLHEENKHTARAGCAYIAKGEITEKIEYNPASYSAYTAGNRMANALYQICYIT